MQHPGWFLLITGLVLAAIGALWLVAPSIPWLGRLPGDLVIERGRVRFYFPLATCLLASGVLTLLMWVLGRLMR